MHDQIVETVLRGGSYCRMVNDVETRAPTDLERMIVLADAGRASMLEVLQVFVRSQIVVPSATEVSSNLDQLLPVLFDVDGCSMLAVFSHVDQIAEFERLASFALTISGHSLLASIPPGAGVVVNPSRSIGFELTPEGLGAFLQELRSRPR